MDSIQSLFKEAFEAFSKNNPAKASELCSAILAQEPAHRDANHLAGIIAYNNRDLHQALKHLRFAVEQGIYRQEIVYNYASILMEDGQLHEALEAYQKILQKNPDHLFSLNKCYNIARSLGLITSAQMYCERMLVLNPSMSDALNHLGNCLKDQLRIDEALECYRKAMEIKPGFTMAASNYLLALNSSAHDRQFIFSEHKELGQRVFGTKPDHAKQDSLIVKNRKINVGYVSADYNISPVSYFIEPVLKNHDYSSFEVFCYSNEDQADEVTRRFQSYPVAWRSISKVNDFDTEKIVRADNIDVLVDLSGHTRGNRLPVFSLRPAPVQITYCGYPNTTGLTAIDYRCTDTIADPPGQELYHTERLFRLPDCFLCYQPFHDLPSVNDTPALKNGHITFGSFNTLAKINGENIALWAQLMNRVPDSRIVFKSICFEDLSFCDRFLAMLEERGVRRERVARLRYSLTVKEHFKTYNQMDIALDTFPYNGTTTTFEALSMGVPVITLEGNTHVSRVGTSILTNLGLQECLAGSREEYLDKACNLAGDLHELNNLRTNLRERLLSSRLCDGKKFTKKIEDMYFQMLHEKGYKIENGNGR